MRLAHLTCNDFVMRPMNVNKHMLHIARKGLCRRDVTIGSPHLHECPKTTIVDNLERSVVLWDPADELSTSTCFQLSVKQAFKLSIPCFDLGMLVGTVQGRSFGYLLKCCHYWPIFFGVQDFQCCFHYTPVFGGIGCINCLITPAHFGMAPQVTGGPGIPCVQVSTNKVFLGLTSACCAFKDVRLTVLNVLNYREGLKKSIYQCVPLLLKSS